LPDPRVAAADFLPPVQGGPTEVSDPDSISVNGNVVEAASAQDGFNVATNAATGGAPEDGSTIVYFPSGIGFVATGLSAYRTNMKNVIAVRQQKRVAVESDAVNRTPRTLLNRNDSFRSIFVSHQYQ
jgi:hypothetical protein